MRSNWLVLLRIFCTALVLLHNNSTYCQNKDSLLKVFPSLTDKAQRIELIYQVLEKPAPQSGLYYHQKLLSLTREQVDKAGEAAVISLIGLTSFLAGNGTTATELQFKALKMAEKAGSEQVVGRIYLYLAISFYGYKDYSKQRIYLDKALIASNAAKDYLFVCWELNNMLEYYLAKGKTDSALYCNQRSMEMATRYGLEEVIPYALTQAGKINYRFGYKGVALEFYQSALKVPYFTRGNGKERAVDKTHIYAPITRFYLSEGKIDSALHYARLNYETAKDLPLNYLMIPAYHLWKTYEKNNSDSALKYATQYYAVKDSIYSAETIQQTQTQALLEQERQRKINEERTQNLQYAAIALGLVTLLIGFLIISHSVIANQKVIKFLGVVSLLIVFEFMNLWLHPFLGELTHHSPVLMLLVMVGIAALLVPIHHKLEHWIINLLVEKNNRIRLAVAKRTIQDLEGITSEMVQNSRE